MYIFSESCGFREAPEDVVGGAGTPAPTPAASPAVTTPTPSPAAPAAGATTTPPAASSSPGSAAATPTPASWLQGFREAGFQTTETDEARVRQQLIQDNRDAQQLRGLAPLATEYQQHREEFNRYLAEKQKQTQTAAAESDWTKKLGWNPPEFDPAWASQLKRGEDGTIVPLPGVPADVALKYQRYTQWRQAEVDKFIANPYKYMEPAIKHLAAEEAKNSSQQSVGSYREQQEATQFVQQHSDWLFDRDATGQVKTQSRFNPATGRHESDRVLSQHGQMFVQRLQEYGRQGLSPAQQQQFAFNDVRVAYMSSPEYTDHLLSQRQAAAQQPGGAAVPADTARQQANAAFLNKSNPATPPAPSAGGNTVPAPQKVDRNNIEAVMLKRMREQGVTIP